MFRSDQRVVRLQRYPKGIAFLGRGQDIALVVQDVKANRRRDMHNDFRRPLLKAFVFNVAQHLKRGGIDRTHPPGAFTMGAGLRAGLGDTGPQSLTRQFHQAKLTDPTELNAGPVGLDHVLHPTLDGVLIARFVHVDEIDDDEAG